MRLTNVSHLHAVWVHVGNMPGSVSSHKIYELYPLCVRIASNSSCRCYRSAFKLHACRSHCGSHWSSICLQIACSVKPNSMQCEASVSSAWLLRAYSLPSSVLNSHSTRFPDEYALVSNACIANINAFLTFVQLGLAEKRQHFLNVLDVLDITWISLN